MLVRQIQQAAGDGGTRTTLAAMAALIHRGAVNPLVRDAAIRLVRGRVGERDSAGQLDILRWFLSTHMTFTPDPQGIEMVHGAEVLLRAIMRDGVVSADCDDAAVLSGALAKALGYRVRLVAVALDGRRGFGHVWAEAQGRDGAWTDFDVTRAAQGLGNRVGRVLTVGVR